MRGTDPDAERFGRIIQDLRWRRNWTLDDLGRFTGMHPDYLGLLERGLNIPSLTTILRLAEAYGVPAGTLLEPIEQERKALRPYRKA